MDLVFRSPIEPSSLFGKVGQACAEVRSMHLVRNQLFTMINTKKETEVDLTNISWRYHV